MNTSRIINNVGITTGFGVNGGYSYGEVYYNWATQSSGTFSYRTSQQNTILNIQTAPNGTVNIAMSASNSLICDTLTILIKSAGTTYSLTYNGDISSDQQLSILSSGTASIPGTSSVITYNKPVYSSTFTIPNGSSVIYTGTYDGNKFRGQTSVQTS